MQRGIASEQGMVCVGGTRISGGLRFADLIQEEEGHMRGWKSVVLLVLMACAMAMPAAAQVSTGRIEMTVVDSTGAVLPGALVELTGPQAATFTTGGDGAARFLNLPPGVYTVKATLQGFGEYLNKNVPVVAGGNVQLKATLAVGGVQQQVEVTAATPVIDARRTGTSTTVTLEELQRIPSARDPWVVMQTVPGIIVDRVNVGGSESGQQSGYQAKGASSADATWNMDGIPITDMSATGATPMYYDFDSFQEMNVSTGGSDLTATTGGVALNFILRSGTDTPRGSARIYFEDQSMQSNNMPKDLAASIGGKSGKGNRTDQYSDYGFDLGGPIVKGKFWGWGSIGKTDVRIRTLTDVLDRTVLKNYAMKFQYQATQNMRTNFTYYFADKNKWGRGASATRPDETTYNQTGPTPFYKGEVNYVVGNNLFLTGRVAYMHNQFTLDPRGGMKANVYVDDSGVWHGSAFYYTTVRPNTVAMMEGSYFRGKHEMKFGYQWRQTTVTSISQIAGNGFYTLWDGYPNIIAGAYPENTWAAKAGYQSFWFGDSWTMNRMTLNYGVRYDHQTDGITAHSSIGLPGVSYLPPLSTGDKPGLITWSAFSPRASMTYALSESRKTQVRASYAMFASQLGNGASSVVDPVSYRYVYFYGVDKNGNKVADVGEFDQTVDNVGWWTGFDITNPKNTVFNKIGDYHVPRTHELIVGFDHELFKNFGVSASFTYRQMVNFNWRPMIGVRSPIYKQAGTFTATGLPDGSSYTAPYYAVDATKVPASTLDTLGTEYVGRDGYHQQFWGIEATATKRLSDKWMARFGFSTNSHTEYFDNRATSIQDPTPGRTSPYVDGGIVVVASGGSGKSGIYQLLPKYQFIGNGLYQAPWGIDLGFNMTMRQGFGQPWNRSRVPGSSDALSGTKTVLLNPDLNNNRLPMVMTFDMRVGKQFKLKRTTWNFDFDVFNLFNSATVLGRQYDYRLTTFNNVLEIMNPRIARLGLRLGF